MAGFSWVMHNSIVHLLYLKRILELQIANRKYRGLTKGILVPPSRTRQNSCVTCPRSLFPLLVENGGCLYEIVIVICLF